MGQILHGSATTTEAVRRAIQNSQESIRTLAQRYGLDSESAIFKLRRCKIMNSTSSESPLQITLHPLRVAIILGGVALVLSVISFVLHSIEHWVGSDYARWLYHAVRLFSVDYEGNIPTWYSSILLLACASLMALIAAIPHKMEVITARLWTGLAIIFVLLSLDEAAAIHDRMSVPIREWLDVTGYLSFAWVIPGSAFLLIFLLVYLRFWWRLPRPIRNAFLLAGALYVGGALGFEAISANQVYIEGETSLTYFLIATVEELLEMWGIIALLYGLLAALVSGTKVQGIQLVRYGYPHSD